ncbi:nuclear transport factor 2 family protein [Variovorax sp. J22R133]|uniref:nuclear transport factor 2 family protein n=1 Tax=Variovorax brevis TaxID=3053503 RepID=UPI0025759B60|nr:nuclear transport factor 2 family protein [Variovorax sp. J22R133]MDM0115211.1 nuclear transport factor 2 family protein [Variovorax sp. J22R133]
MNILPRPCSIALLVAAAICYGGAAQAAAEDEVRASFERFVQVQNEHDVKALEGLLADSPGFLWITRGTVIWGRDAALQQFAKLYAGTWRLDPEYGGLRVVPIGNDVAEVHVPVQFTTGPAGQAPQSTRLFLNQVLVKSGGAWRVLSIFPIAAPAP